MLNTEYYEMFHETENKLKKRVLNEFTESFSKPEKIGKLEKQPQQLDCFDLINVGTNYKLNENIYVPNKDGVIVVAGGTPLKEKEILSVGKTLGIRSKRFELYLDYKGLQKTNFAKILSSPKYCAILCGPAPHSGYGKGKSRSILAGIENYDGYAIVVRLCCGDTLKITKTNVYQALQKLISGGFIVAG